MAELVSIKRNVDVSPGQAAPAVFHCSQGDVGTKIILGLLNNGTAYSIPSGVTVTIEGSESNGSIFTPISATVSGSDITFYLTGEMTAVAGPAICQAVLKSGSNILGTANFTLEVESSPMGADAPPVFTDAGWTWMLNKLNTEFVPALGNETIIDAIDSKLDKNQGTANAGKYLKVGADGNVETADLDVTTDKTLSIADKAADAKAVGDEITNLKADLDSDVENVVRTLALQDETTLSPWFEQGSISNTGAETVSYIRIRSNFINLKGMQSVIITPANGYKVAVELYDEGRGFKRELGFTPNTRTVLQGDGTNDGYYIRLLLAHTDNTAILPSEGVNVAVTAKTIIKSALTNLNDADAIPYNDIKDATMWSYGRVGKTTGSISVDNTVIHSDYISAHKGDVVFSQWVASDRTGYTRFNVVLFSGELTPSNVESGYMAYPYEIPYDCIIRINARKADATTITTEEKASLIENLYYTKHAVNNTKWEYDEGATVKSINHRGWIDAPENTIPAYVESFRHGFKYIETDIRFTSDGVPVCMHDATLNRTCRNADGTELSETTNISDITYAESQDYDAGVYKGESYSGTKIPKLEEVLMLCKALDLLPYLDISTTPHPSYENIMSIIDCVINTGMVGRVTFLSNFDVLIWVTQALPNARVATTNTLNISFVRYYKALMTGYNQVFANVQYSEALSDRINTCKDIGLPVEIWTVNDTTVIDAMDEYISGVSSDSIIASDYLKSKNAPTVFTKPKVSYDRVKDITNGYVIKGNRVIVNCGFTSKYTASNSPAILRSFPQPLSGSVCMSVAELNENDNDISGVLIAVLLNTTLYINSITSGKRYVLTGEYLI